MIKIEAATQDYAIEERHERAYHKEVDRYLASLIDKVNFQMESTVQFVNDEAERLIRESNLERNAANGHYDPFDQKRITAQNLFSKKLNTQKECEKNLTEYRSQQKEPFFGRVDYAKKGNGTRKRVTFVNRYSYRAVTLVF